MTTFNTFLKESAEESNGSEHFSKDDIIEMIDLLDEEELQEIGEELTELINDDDDDDDDDDIDEAKFFKKKKKVKIKAGDKKKLAVARKKAYKKNKAKIKKQQKKYRAMVKKTGGKNVRHHR